MSNFPKRKTLGSSLAAYDRWLCHIVLYLNLPSNTKVQYYTEYSTKKSIRIAEHAPVGAKLRSFVGETLYIGIS